MAGRQYLLILAIKEILVALPDRVEQAAFKAKMAAAAAVVMPR